MKVQFVGGPWNGRIQDVIGTSSTFRIFQQPRLSNDRPDDVLEPEIIDYRQTPWTRHGAMLFVAPGYDRSLIGYDEIWAAGEWLAGRESECGPPVMVGTYDIEALIEMRADYFKAAINHYRDQNPPGPDHSIQWTIVTGYGTGPVRRFTVKIAPGLVFGFEDGELDPCWRWPYGGER